MRSRDGPADRREIILMMENRDISVQRVVSRIPNLSINKEHLLMNLHRVVKKLFWGLHSEWHIPMRYLRSKRPEARTASLVLGNGTVH